MEVAFVLASFTCLKAFLRPFGAGYLITQSETPISGYRTRAKSAKGSAYHMLSGTREKQQSKSGILVSRTETAVENTPHELATVPRALLARGNSTNFAHVTPQSRGRASTESKDRMIINQTNTFTVEYEYDDDNTFSREAAGRAL